MAAFPGHQQTLAIRQEVKISITCTFLIAFDSRSGHTQAANDPRPVDGDRGSSAVQKNANDGNLTRPPTRTQPQEEYF